MTKERWDDLVGRIKDTFTVLEEFSEELVDEPGMQYTIIFEAPSGKMKLEYVTQPVVLGTHAIGSRRIGASSTVSYDYSESETRDTLSAFRWHDNDWVTVDADALLAATSSPKV